jgi:hypothetical protein
MMGSRHVLRASWRAGWAIALLAYSILFAAQSFGQQTATPEPSATQTAAEPAPQPLPPSSALRGRELFVGTRRFANGGPACASCHRAAGISFPNGGTLGPDLSGIYDQFGPDALQTILQTLFFPTMAPIFGKRPLTAQEQSDLSAFFQQTSAKPLPALLTGKIVVPAVGGFLLLLALAGGLWHNRLRTVRKSFVAQVKSTGDARS